VRAVTADAASAAVRRRIATDSLLAVLVGTASQVADPVRKAVPSLTESRVVPFDAE
jgi:zinc protease